MLSLAHQAEVGGDSTVPYKAAPVSSSASTPLRPIWLSLYSVLVDCLLEEQTNSEVLCSLLY